MIVSPLVEEEMYQLKADFKFIANGLTFIIPAGFVFDGASIPKIFWTITTSPFNPKVMRAACIHDFLYRTHAIPRKQADKLFMQILIEDGMAEESAEVLYSAVRVGGHTAYKTGRNKPLKGTWT